MDNSRLPTWNESRSLSLVPSPQSPRWSDWHWSAGGRIVRVNLDNIQEEEECGDRLVLEQNREILKEVRQDYLDSALNAKSKSRAKELMRGVRDKERQIAWVERKLSELALMVEGDCLTPETFFHKKEESADFLMENTSTIFHKKGRGKNKIPPSGSLVPVVQKKRDKQGRIVEYPRVEGERVSRDLAFDYPHQFVWLYCWAVQEDGSWKNCSKSVPRNRIGTVKAAIADHIPVSEILSLIDL